MKYLLALLALCTAMFVHAADPLTNDSVIEMVKLGLSEDVVKAKISAGPTFFDTSNRELARLQKAGVSSTIVAAMIGAGAASTPKPAAAALPAAFGGAAIGSESQFYYGAPESLTRIKATRVASEFSNRKAWIPFGGLRGPEVFLFIDGQTSGNALPSGEGAQFRTAIDPLNLRLVKLGLHNKRHDRFIVFQGSYSDREIQFGTSQDANGMYVLEVPQHLERGEYAFLYNPNSSAGGFWALLGQQAGTAVAFDFAVH